MIYPWGTHHRFFSSTQQNINKYGARVQKVSVNAGFTCPNRDGTKGRGGCTFCDNLSFSPGYCHTNLSITQQIDKGVKFLQHRYKKVKHYIAYFQSFSNTYAPVGILKERYEEALQHPAISGISVGTRPDCVNNENLEYLASLAEKHIVMLELGVESCYDKTLERVNRGHTFAESVDAIKMAAALNIHTGIHLIIGLPGETREEILAQAPLISSLPINSIKLHQLQIVKNTALAKQYSLNPEEFHFFTPDEYAGLIAHFLEQLRPDIAIERIAGEIPPDANLRKAWDGIRSDQMIIKVKRQMENLDTWQGKYYKGNQI